MKFISTATTAALAGIILLAPAAYGNQHYKCDDGDPVGVEEAQSMEDDCASTKNLDEHPAILTGESHKSYLFARRVYLNKPGISIYMIQVYGNPKKYQLSRHVDKEWIVCSLQDIS
ncbi:CSEP0254 putative effector protein [Blumeria hordei DH14]|uniref:CSEP0254 putative effector protein n=1 Tax=Blumeria graminis f. sp. hordei (strain DH14) TaxID=546991 RepID=N1J7E2_BLUG1|nr:CSEP0254 putative effector protein [Blumeria hordei DH14]